MNVADMFIFRCEADSKSIGSQEMRMRADNGGRVFCSSGLIDFNMM